MNSNDDPSTNRADALSTRLRREAAAERPAFSPELHDRIMQKILREPSAGTPNRKLRLGRRSAVFKAAAILLIVGSIVLWFGMPSRQPVNPPNRIAEQVVAPPSGQTQARASTSHAITDPVPLGDLVSATIWPPEIRINLPDDRFLRGPEAPAEQPITSTPSVDSLDLLFGKLQQPAQDAKAALTMAIPPNMRALARFLTADH